jgi:hypothetical protein
MILSDTIRVGLNDHGVWLFLQKGLEATTQITNVLLCARDAPFRAIK